MNRAEIKKKNCFLDRFWTMSNLDSVKNYLVPFNFKNGGFPFQLSSQSSECQGSMFCVEWGFFQCHTQSKRVDGLQLLYCLHLVSHHATQDTCWKDAWKAYLASPHIRILHKLPLGWQDDDLLRLSSQYVAHFLQ